MKVLVLGESHAHTFDHMNTRQKEYKFTTCVAGGASARGINRENSETQSYKKYNAMMNYSTSYDKIIIMLGEVDCAYLAWICSYKYNTHVDVEIEKSYTSLFRFIDEIVVGKFKFCPSKVMVAGSTLTPIKDGTDRSQIYAGRPNVLANQELINTKIMMYNSQLESMCETRGFTYFDITKHIIGDNKSVKVEYTRPSPYDIHLKFETCYKHWLSEFEIAIGKKD